MDEVAGGWGRMHKVELHNLYSTPNIITVYQIHEDDTGEWKMQTKFSYES